MIGAPNPWAFAADILDPPERYPSAWYLPNDGWPEPDLDVEPDRSVWHRDDETGVWWILGRARPKQRPPAGDWMTWLLMAGRGFGKTRTGTEWIDAEARSGRAGRQLILAGRTPSDVRDYLLEGDGGLLTHHPDVVYVPSKRHVSWPNGSVGLIRSGANPEEFRGFSGRRALLDEFPAWDYPQMCWDNLVLGMREEGDGSPGDRPRIGIATTPRPISALRAIARMPSTVVVRGSSYENRANLSEKWVSDVLEPLAGTRLGRQEVGGELIEDVEGALWSRSAIEAGRRRPADAPEMKRVVVGVDPQGTRSSDVERVVLTADGRTHEVEIAAHETGIVVAGAGVDGRFYVLEDATINGSPAEWGARAVEAYRRWGADRIVGERNFGGDMVEATIRAVDAAASFRSVVASRGKQRRAEPVSALYEKGVVSHVGAHPALEDEMCSYAGAPGDRSPNRMDALVWAMTELMGGGAGMTFRVYRGR